MIRIAGVFAALITPRDSTGALDLASYRQQLASLSNEGLTGYAINGATGEFPRNSEKEIETLLEITRQIAPQAKILCGIGAPDLHGTLRRARLAAAAGASAALLSMPFFFTYRQDDLYAYASSVASEAELPILLYNLPQFTSGLEVDTVLALLTDYPNVIGIKDSSGSLDILRAITRAQLGASRLVGNDSTLIPAMEEGLTDGVVSGIACALPELITAIYLSKGIMAGDLRRLLDESIEAMASFPAPWGLKVASAIRGFTTESYPFPLSADRKNEIAALHTWFRSRHRPLVVRRAGSV